MLRYIAILLVLTITPTVLASELRIHRDLAYTDPPDRARRLDVYAPASGTGHPIIVWIHGGGWRRGDKANMQHKPQAFVDKGYLFVSVNYRFVPRVTIGQMTGDIAKAIKWVHDHAKQYGGAPDTIFVAGHSAGAHLAALVCTDVTYVEADGLSRAIIKGCIPVDTAAYDVPRRLVDSAPLRPSVVAAAFGKNTAAQKRVSPMTYVAKGKHIPPFLILYVADRPRAAVQSRAFADELKRAGVTVDIVPAKDKTHATINRELGLPDDAPTRVVFEFLDACVKRTGCSGAAECDS